MCPWPNGKTIAHYPILPNPPPAFIASAEDDTVAPIAFAKEIAQAVKQQKGSVETFYVPNGGHAAFHYGVSKGTGTEWPNALLKMLEQR